MYICYLSRERSSDLGLSECAISVTALGGHTKRKLDKRVLKKLMMTRFMGFEWINGKKKKRKKLRKKKVKGVRKLRVTYKMVEDSRAEKKKKSGGGDLLIKFVVSI